MITVGKNSSDKTNHETQLIMMIMLITVRIQCNCTSPLTPQTGTIQRAYAWIIYSIYPTENKQEIFMQRAIVILSRTIKPNVHDSVT